VKYDQLAHKKVQRPSLITPYLTVPDAEGFIKVNAFALINRRHTLLYAVIDCNANTEARYENAYARHFVQQR
jgi:hypothetical protein